MRGRRAGAHLLPDLDGAGLGGGCMADAGVPAAGFLAVALGFFASRLPRSCPLAMVILWSVRCAAGQAAAAQTGAPVQPRNGDGAWHIQAHFAGADDEGFPWPAGATMMESLDNRATAENKE